MVTTEEFLNQGQSSKFFLGSRLSQVVNSDNESTIEEEIY